MCRKCNKKGHLARVCRSQKSASRNGKMSGAGAQAHQLTLADSGSEEEQLLYRLEQHKASPIMVNVQVNGVPVSMELDTGAAVSVMLQQQQKELFSTAQLQPSKVILRTYTAQSVGVVETLPVKVVYEEQEKDLSLFIVQGKGPALFGQDWLTSITLKWPSIAYHSVGGMNLEELLRQLLTNLTEVLGRIHAKGFRLKKEKYHFFKPIVEYLGHLIDAQGLHTTPSK